MNNGLALQEKLTSDFNILRVYHSLTFLIEFSLFFKKCPKLGCLEICKALFSGTFFQNLKLTFHKMSAKWWVIQNHLIHFFLFLFFFIAKTMLEQRVWVVSTGFDIHAEILYHFYFHLYLFTWYKHTRT